MTEQAPPRTSCNPLQGIELLDGIPITGQTLCPICARAALEWEHETAANPVCLIIHSCWWQCPICGWRTPGLWL